MKRYIRNLLLVSAIAVGSASCSSRHYAVQSVDYQRVTFDSLFDATPDVETVAFLAPFKLKVDSIMSPVVGQLACDMLADRPESKLSNLIADILVWAGKGFDEQPVFSVCNMGGIRASLSKGDVTIGNVNEVAPFENKLCFMTLKGSHVITLFEQIAARGGEGVSHSVRAVISKDKKLVSLKINGETINPDAEYRISTIDYLAEGNDGLPILKEGFNRKMLTDKSNNLRFIIMDFFRENMKNNRVVDSEVEGRITVE
jgi:2',3'-cyclic-nucleotide 2'-phosphodiesterase (5'-nucleotidase family)